MPVVTVYRPQPQARATWSDDRLTFGGPHVHYRVDEGGNLHVGGIATSTQEGAVCFARGQWSWVQRMEDGPQAPESKPEAAPRDGGVTIKNFVQQTGAAQQTETLSLARGVWYATHRNGYVVLPSDLFDALKVLLARPDAYKRLLAASMQSAEDWQA